MLRSSSSLLHLAMLAQPAHQGTILERTLSRHILPRTRQWRRKKTVHRSPTSLYALFPLPNTPDTAPHSRMRFRQGPITLLAFPANDRKRLFYTIIHGRRLRQARRWVETPQPTTESISLLPHEWQRSWVYAIDCKMVRVTSLL